jgi:glycosyltransferase involved in cell wall biosynthesis
MHETVKELVMAERAMGIEAQVLHPQNRDGGQNLLYMGDVAKFHAHAGPTCMNCGGQARDDKGVPCPKCQGEGTVQIPIPQYPSDIMSKDGRHLCTASYDWALREGDIHIMHWKGDNMSEKLKPLIFCSHGSYPEYCLSTELFAPQMGSPFTGTLQRLKDADATVAFTKRQAWFLNQLSFGEVHHIPFGIDLWRYRPKGPRIKDMKGKPVCGYLEQWRDFKLPDTFIHAIKYASDFAPEIGMCIAGAEADPQLFNKLATELGVDTRFTPAKSVMARITYPEQFYRAFDVFFNPVLTGETSRTGREAMACGTPTIGYKTRKEWDTEPYFYRADLFDPIDVGEGILKIWEKMSEDEKSIRAEARIRAVKTWDIRNTANQFIKLVQDVTNRYDLDLRSFSTEVDN